MTLDLAQFTGTETWYRHGMIRSIVFTDGVKHVADQAGAYWLIDEMVFNQMRPKVRREPFQVWTLTRNKTGNGARLSCSDGNGNKLFSKLISYTDFPDPTISFYFTDRTILLPSEY